MATTPTITDPSRWTAPDNSTDVHASLKRLEPLSWASYELTIEVRNLHAAGVTALPRRLRRKVAAARAAYAAEELVLAAAREHARKVIAENRKAAAVLAAAN